MFLGFMLQTGNNLNFFKILTKVCLNIKTFLKFKIKKIKSEKKISQTNF